MTGVPYVFSSQTSPIPLAELDANFNTQITIGSTQVGLGNSASSLANLTSISATNANISSKLFVDLVSDPTGVASLGAGAGSSAIAAFFYVTGTSSSCINARVDNASSPYCVFEFSGTNTGTITTDGTSTAYNTSSDRRLKNITGDLLTSGAFIDALAPRVGTWIATGSSFAGFLADEVQAVSPSSVRGDPGAVDDMGNPVYQSMAYASDEIIANMVAELKSLRARVAALEAK
jgi:hypothetical protein